MQSPRTIEFPLPRLLRSLLLRPEGRQCILLPSINELGALAPPCLLQDPVTGPFALSSDRRQLRHESPHRQSEFQLALASKIIGDSVPTAHDAKAGFEQLSLPGTSADNSMEARVGIEPA